MRVWTTILAAGSMLCFCAAWASATNGTNVVVAVAQSAKVAAEKGDPAAQFRYAEMLRDGRDVAKNVREAVVWTRKAADGGLVAA